MTSAPVTLVYRKSLPIDEIKIDRSFITDMGSGEDVIVRSMVDLGRNLGLEVTAEGVEDQDTCTALLKLG